MISPEIIAILNITPDSFSDGGKYNNIDSALAKTEALINEGADIIDIGAQSTRPGATSLSQDEEWSRLSEILPHIINIAKKYNKLTSIDTYHNNIAIKAIDLGINIINDVSNSKDLQLISIKNNVKIVVTHSLTIPADKNITLEAGVDVVEFIRKFAEDKINELIGLGGKLENIIFDPGIGFGKDPYQSFDLIKNIAKFTDLGADIMVGHSRKSLYNMLNDPTESRDLETHITSIYLASKNVKYLRVHDVSGTIASINLANILNIC